MEAQDSEETVNSAHGLKALASKSAELDSDWPQLVFNFCEPGLVYLLNGDNKSNLMGSYKMGIKYLVLSVWEVESYGSCNCRGY